MPKLKNLKVHAQSGMPDSMGRPIPGLFIVTVDPHALRAQAERASQLKGRSSTDGAVTVEWSPTSTTGAQAEWFVQQFTRDSMLLRGDPRGEEFPEKEPKKASRVIYACKACGTEEQVSPLVAALLRKGELTWVCRLDKTHMVEA